MQEGNEVPEFYSELPRPVLVGIEAIGPMQWFLNLPEELGIACQVGDATKIRATEPRKRVTEQMLGGAAPQRDAHERNANAVATTSAERVG